MFEFSPIHHSGQSKKILVFSNPYAKEEHSNEVKAFYKKCSEENHTVSFIPEGQPFFFTGSSEFKSRYVLYEIIVLKDVDQHCAFIKCGLTNNYLWTGNSSGSWETVLLEAINALYSQIGQSIPMPLIAELTSKPPEEHFDGKNHIHRS